MMFWVQFSIGNKMSELTSIEKDLYHHVKTFAAVIYGAYCFRSFVFHLDFDLLIVSAQTVNMYYSAVKVWVKIVMFWSHWMNNRNLARNWYNRLYAEKNITKVRITKICVKAIKRNLANNKGMITSLDMTLTVWLKHTEAGKMLTNFKSTWHLRLHKLRILNLTKQNENLDNINWEIKDYEIMLEELIN